MGVFVLTQAQGGYDVCPLESAIGFQDLDWNDAQGGCVESLGCFEAGDDAGGNRSSVAEFVGGGLPRIYKVEARGQVWGQIFMRGTDAAVEDADADFGEVCNRGRCWQRVGAGGIQEVGVGARKGISAARGWAREGAESAKDEGSGQGDG